jgi:hypothetical protein
MTVVFAFAAAFCNALNVVTQHVASTAAPARTRGWRLDLYVVRHPLWLLGVAADVAAFAFQAMALYEGRLSVVQTILVTELVFSLVIGRAWLRRAVRAVAWMSASVTSVGLAIFLLASEPEGGSRHPTPGLWLPALVMVGGAVVVLTVLADRGSAARRAALYGSASAIAWATMATLLKSATDVLAGGELGGLLSNGAVYRRHGGRSGGHHPHPGGATPWTARRLAATDGDRRSVRQHHAGGVALRRGIRRRPGQGGIRGGWLRDDRGRRDVPQPSGPVVRSAPVAHGSGLVDVTAVETALCRRGLSRP